MKGLQFLGNRVEDAANAFIDVLKYSDQSVDYPVALVYLPKPSSTKLVIRHLDDNPLNNHVDNLRWGTQKQNMEDARKNGKLRGSSCKASRAKLSKKDLILIFKLKAKGLYYKDIAKRLGVSVGTIGRVINKKSYRDENIDRKR